MRRTVLLLFSFLFLSYGAKIIEDTFSRIKNTPGEQLVVFYRSSDPESAAILKIVEKVAKDVNKYRNGDISLSHFGFKKCDGDLEVNRADFEEAQFVKGTTFLFTSTPVEGIEKYSGARTAEAIAEHIKHKYLPYDDTDVVKWPAKADEDWFWSRLDSQPEGATRPVFVKFYEEWCEHCKRMKLNFVRAAGYFKAGIPGSPDLPGVDFMEIHCSRDDDTTSFCVHNNVRSYPVLMLFTGEKKILFQESEKTINNYAHFFKTNLSPVSASSVSPSSSTPSSSPSSSEDDDEPVQKPAKKEKPLPSRRVDPPVVETPPSPEAVEDEHRGNDKDSEEDTVVEDRKPRPLGRFAPSKDTEAPSAVPVVEPSGPSSVKMEQRLSALENSVEEIKYLSFC